MPKSPATDLITDQEMLFARLVLSGTMTDRQAAEAAGLDPNTAAYIKSKPRVQAYMLEHRATVKAQLDQQESDELRRKSICRERVLARLWEIADMSPELTRNSAAAQIKALSMIAAIEGLTPDRRAAEKKSADSQPPVNIFQPQWLLESKAREAAAKAGFDLVPHKEDPAILDPTTVAAPDIPPTPGETLGSKESNFAHSTKPVSASDPNAPTSTKKPYVERYGPF